MIKGYDFKGNTSKNSLHRMCGSMCTTLLEVMGGKAANSIGMGKILAWSYILVIEIFLI